MSLWFAKSIFTNLNNENGDVKIISTSLLNIFIPISLFARKIHNFKVWASQ